MTKDFQCDVKIRFYLFGLQELELTGIRNESIKLYYCNKCNNTSLSLLLLFISFYNETQCLHLHLGH